MLGPRAVIGWMRSLSSRDRQTHDPKGPKKRETPAPPPEPSLLCLSIQVCHSSRRSRASAPVHNPKCRAVSSSYLQREGKMHTV